MKKKIIRHGELCFIKIDKLPKNLEENKTNVIAKGSSNNSHSFKGGEFYPKKDGIYIIGYFEAKNTKLYHPEHGEKKVGNLLESGLPDGYYEVRTQFEYTPEGLRQVID